MTTATTLILMTSDLRSALAAFKIAMRAPALTQRVSRPAENKRAKDYAASWLFAQYGAPLLK